MWRVPLNLPALLFFFPLKMAELLVMAHMTVLLPLSTGSLPRKEPSLLLTCLCCSWLGTYLRVPSLGFAAWVFFYLHPSTLLQHQSFCLATSISWWRHNCITAPVLWSLISMLFSWDMADRVLAWLGVLVILGWYEQSSFYYSQKPLPLGASVAYRTFVL